MKGPRVVHSLPALRRAIAEWRASGERIALVPTMGALHEGHISLVHAGARRATRIVVSIFVNPTQFAPNEDFAKYPRTLPRDRALLAATKADLIWAPGVETMYPDGFSTMVTPAGPAKAGLEDAFRPHFFAGVATIVGKLLLQTTPDIAMFGEKDYQQLKVVTRMARDLDIPTRIIGCPTLREADGLAMSSRNVYLSAEERRIAVTPYAAMSAAAEAIRSGAPIARALAAGRRRIEKAGFVLDYFEARHAETLAKLAKGETAPLRLLFAAKLGATRLIDNIPV